MSSSATIPTESSNENGFQTQKRKVRGQSKGANVEKKIKKTKNPLVVEFDAATGKSYGDNGKAFNNMIGQQVRDVISPSIFRWDDVPEEDKTLILERLQLKFVYDRSNILILDEIERLAMKSFRGWRHILKKHWKLMGGEKDPNAPRTNPPENIQLSDWLNLCDYFCSEKQKELSEKNSANRSMMPFESRHGSKSYFSHMKSKEDPTTKEMPSLVDNFKDMHWHPTKGWINETASDKFTEMDNLRSTQRTNISQPAGSDVTVDQPDILSDDQIVDMVLGTRSRYKKGRGPMPRLKAIGGTRAANNSVYNLYKDQAATIASLTQKLTETQDNFEGLLEQLKKHLPGFNYQPPNVSNASSSNA